MCQLAGAHSSAKLPLPGETTSWLDSCGGGVEPTPIGCLADWSCWIASDGWSSAHPHALFPTVKSLDSFDFRRDPVPEQMLCWSLPASNL